MKRYYCSDENADFASLVEAPNPAAAAREYVESGNYDVTETIYVSVHVRRARPDEERPDIPVADRRRGTWHSVRVDPPEPSCTAEGHEWALPDGNRAPFLRPGIHPGAWGHGGGTVTVEVCRHCGWYRTTDTWATDPSDGSIVETLEYDAPDAASQAWIRSQA